MNQVNFYRNIVLSLFLACSTSSAMAQRPWQEYIDQLSEMEDEENFSWEDYEDLFAECAEHPINLNTATKEDLEQFPFLSAQQIEDIQAYIYQYGAMKSLGELAMITSIDWYHRQLLSCFVYVGEVKQRTFPTLENVLKYVKQEAVADFKLPFYQRKGDKEGYLGYPYKHWVRYQFRRGDYVKMGILGSQDAGEPFFGGKNTMGYDFYSFYVQVKKWGRLKNLTLGRYRLREGMGLILNNDFGFGKMSMLSSLGRMGTTIRAHSSRSAVNYLQGAAATVSVGKGLDLSAFVSCRKIDATMHGDSISTIVTTGLHRTSSEIEKQKVASMFLVGGNLHYSFRGLHLGMTALGQSFSRELHPNKQLLYKRFAPEGKRFWNASIDYGYVSSRLTLQGETATGDCGAVATINSASYLFSEHFSLVGLYRFYSYRYYALQGNSFRAGSEVQDESGGYLGMRWSPSSRWVIDVCGDMAYFPWPKFHTTGTTTAMDARANVVFRPSDMWMLTARYQYKVKNKATTQRMRISVGASGRKLSHKAQMDVTLLSQNAGYMLSEKLTFRHRWLRVDGLLGYFHTKDYDSRVYVYEPSLLYTMSFGSFYGEGIRYVLLARTEIGKHLIAMAKLGVTDYFDRTHISSGLQEIGKSSQADLEIQLKYRW